MIDYKSNNYRTVGTITPGPWGKNHFWSGSKDYGPVGSGVPKGYFGEGSPLNQDAGKKIYFHEYGCLCELCAADNQKIPKGRGQPPVYSFKEHRATERIAIDRNTAAGIISEIIAYYRIHYGREYIVGEFSISDGSVFDFLLITGADYISTDMKIDDVVNYLFSGKSEPLVRAKITVQSSDWSNRIGILTLIPQGNWRGWDVWNV